MAQDLNSLLKVVVDITIYGRMAPMRTKYGDAKWAMSTLGERGTDHVYRRTSARLEVLLSALQSFFLRNRGLVL